MFKVKKGGDIRISCYHSLIMVFQKLRGFLNTGENTKEFEYDEECHEVCLGIKPDINVEQCRKDRMKAISWNLQCDIFYYLYSMTTESAFGTNLDLVKEDKNKYIVTLYISWNTMIQFHQGTYSSYI